MNLFDILLLFFIAVALAAALFHCLRPKRRNSGCGHGCAGCPGAGSCAAQSKKS